MSIQEECSKLRTGEEGNDWVTMPPLPPDVAQAVLKHCEEFGIKSFADFVMIASKLFEREPRICMSLAGIAAKISDPGDRVRVFLASQSFSEPDPDLAELAEEVERPETPPHSVPQ